VVPGETLAVHHDLVDREHGKICTLFVAGIPDDVKPREIHNLFSRRPDFESSLLEFTGKGNQVFFLINFIYWERQPAFLRFFNLTFVH
jgi:hypothetical protein